MNWTIPVMTWILNAAQKPSRTNFQACDQSRRDMMKSVTSKIWKERYNEVRQSLDQRRLRKIKRQRAEGEKRKEETAVLSAEGPASSGVEAVLIG